LILSVKLCYLKTLNKREFCYLNPKEETLAGKAAPKKNLSAIKRARQAEKNRLRNKAVKTTIKTITKKVEMAVSGKKKEELQKAFADATKVITKAASKGVLHRNAASRKISRLARIANTLIRPEVAS